MTRLLEVDDLAVELRLEEQVLPVLSGVSIAVDGGRTLGIVGESGCGKTMLSLAMMGLLPPAARATGGRVLLDGDDLLTLPDRELAELQGRSIAMVYQDATRSLHPSYTVGHQISEAIRRHGSMTRRQAWARTVELLGHVGIPDPASRAHSYPFEFSGGMCQRAMIAMAISCEPEVVIADEPTSALDATVEAEVIALLLSLQRELGIALVLVTHDLGLVAATTDDVAVLYAGQVVECGDTVRVLSAPAHPYTEALLTAVPDGDRRVSGFHALPGAVPNLGMWPPGCRLFDRCPHAVQGRCDRGPIPLDTGPRGDVRCVRAAELELRGALS